MKKIYPIILLALFTFNGNLAFSEKYEYDNLNRLSRVIFDSSRQIIYHYDASGNRTSKIQNILTDFNHNGFVSLEDFALFSLQWLETDCDIHNWCDEADLNYSGVVDFADFFIFVESWMSQ